MAITRITILCILLITSGANVFASGIGGAIRPLPAATIDNPQKIRLGFLLFSDPRLSEDGTISCASCHQLQNYGTDRQPLSTGVHGRTGRRNTPSVYNAALHIKQFWDGRADTLEQQLDGPVTQSFEMNNSWQAIITTLAKDSYYQNQFRELYPQQGISEVTIKDAIVHFERTLLTPNSPFDHYLLGDDTAITEEAKQGFLLFQEYGCISCHQGRAVGGNMFEKFGVHPLFSDETLQQLRGIDSGRFAQTQNEEDRFEFKVPSLRNVTETAPYFHNGSVDTLEQAIFYMGKYQLGVEIPTSDIASIIAFLETLTAPLPPLPQ